MRKESIERGMIKENVPERIGEKEEGKELAEKKENARSGKLVLDALDFL